MSILSAQSVRDLAAKEHMIIPFCDASMDGMESHRSGLSYGLSACGYDIRIDQDIVLHPINIFTLLFGWIFGWSSFKLGSSLEVFSIPVDVAAIVMDKSTWARQGLAVQNTIAEPGWRGFLTVELSNHGNKIIHIRKGTPIAQVVFHWLDEDTELPYQGKYQGQERGPQRARFT